MVGCSPRQRLLQRLLVYAVLAGGPSTPLPTGNRFKPKMRRTHGRNVPVHLQLQRRNRPKKMLRKMYRTLDISYTVAVGEMSLPILAGLLKV